MSTEHNPTPSDDVPFDQDPGDITPSDPSVFLPDICAAFVDYRHQQDGGRWLPDDERNLEFWPRIFGLDCIEWMVRIHNSWGMDYVQRNPFQTLDIQSSFALAIIASIYHSVCLCMYHYDKDIAQEWYGAKATQEHVVHKYLYPPANGARSSAPLAPLLNAAVAQSVAETEARGRLIAASAARVQAVMTRFDAIHDQCESPLEQIFLVGLVTYSEWGMALINIPGCFKVQHVVGHYRLDFAIIVPGTEQKAAIELDGHNYHERTVEQAVRDRSRDRDLQSDGWFVLRFHRKEIETNLETCINALARHVNGLTSSPDFKLL